MDHLLHRSLNEGGPHLVSILNEDRTLDAATLCDRLNQPLVLVVATVSSDGRPLASPVDGTFYRGRFFFSTSPDALKMRHLRRRPDVTACFAPSLAFAVTVHGRAEFVDHKAVDGGALRDAIAATYVPLYGEGFTTFLDSLEGYVAIEPSHMFVFADSSLS
jgi:uncharacterized pyridoxamine 5'-phosphate oxidase family protein